MTNILLTGASGFLGAHALRHIMTETDADVYMPVTFRHAGRAARIISSLRGIARGDRRAHAVECDLTDRACTALVCAQLPEIDFIINYASESHVDRSIEQPVTFIRNNVDLALNVLEMARTLQPRAIVQVSTDEVYGPAAVGHNHVEWETHLPSNPYSASKSAQEAIAFSYWRTFGVPVIIVNSMNLIGELQDPEKYVPKIMRAVHRGDKLTVHASADGVIGSRYYLHARNLIDAILFILAEGAPAKYDDGGGALMPDKYHVVGEREVSNLELAKLVAEYMGKPLRYELQDFHTSRPGHDLRYALDGGKIAALGWRAPISFEDSLRKTVEWYTKNPDWSEL